jgi:hypothetical protein
MKFGIELETCAHVQYIRSQSTNALLSLLNKVQNTVNWVERDVHSYKDNFTSKDYNSWFITQDDSVICEHDDGYCIQNGFHRPCRDAIEFVAVEFVSPVYEANDVHNMIKVVNSLQNDQLVYLINESQGLHVTISDKNLAKNFLPLWVIFENIFMKLADESRRNGYPKPIRPAIQDEFIDLAVSDDDRTYLEQFKDVLGFSRTNIDKSYVVNLKSNDKIEIRLYQGTMKSREIELWVRFCLDLASAARTFNVDKVPEELLYLDTNTPDDNLFVYLITEVGLSQESKGYLFANLPENLTDIRHLLPAKPNISIDERKPSPTTDNLPTSTSGKQSPTTDNLPTSTSEKPSPTTDNLPTSTSGKTSCNIDIDCPENNFCFKRSERFDGRCIEKEAKYYEAILEILNAEIPNLSKLGTLNIIENGGEMVGPGLGIVPIAQKPNYWKCNSDGSCSPSSTPTRYLYQDVCEENCHIKNKKRRRTKRARRNPIYWECVNSRCYSSKIPTEYKSAQACLSRCGGGVITPTISCDRLSDPFYKQFTIIKGHMQSGKTDFMIGAAIRYRLCGISTLIVLRNSIADKVQIRDRMKKRWAEYEEAFLRAGIHLPLKLTFPEGRNIAEDLKISPHIYVELGNVVDIRKITENLEAHPENADNLVLFVDESDSIMGDIVEEDNINGVQITKQLDKIKSKCYCTFAVSATILDNVMKENVNNGNILILDPPSNYKGISQLKQHPLSHPINSLGQSNKDIGDRYMNEGVIDLRKIDDYFERDPNLQPYISTLNTKTYPESFTVVQDMNMVDVQIPNIALLNFTNGREHMYRIYEYIAQDFENIIPIVWTGDFLKLYPRQSLEIPNNIKFTLINNHYIFPIISIEDMFEILKNNKIETTRKNIAIITGGKADRGISFAGGNNPRWHLTQMYYNPSDTRAQPDLLQSVGRLCGTINDPIPLELYAVPSVIKDVFAAYHLQEYLIGEAKNSRQTKLAREIIQTITDVPVDIRVKQKGIYKGKMHRHMGRNTVAQKAEFKPIVMENTVRYNKGRNSDRVMYDKLVEKIRHERWEGAWISLERLGYTLEDLARLEADSEAFDEKVKGLWMAEDFQRKNYIRYNS